MKLVLDRVAELTSRNKKMCKMIRTRESALCKLRKTYKAQKPKEVCQFDSKSLIQPLSSLLNIDMSRFLACIRTKCRQCLIKFACAVSCLMNCQKEL